MLNVAVLMGRLTADPELRTTPNNISVCRFTVAVDRSYQKAGTERQADFITCVAWRQTAEFISRYFAKGQMIAITGSIQTGSYTDNNGNKRYTTEVVVDNASFTASKREYHAEQASKAGQSSYSGTSYPQDSNSNNYNSAPKPDYPPAPAYNSGSEAAFNDDPFDDDLPF